MLVLAVKENQVREGLWRERRVVQKEIQFLETSLQISLNVHKSLVMKSDGIELLFISGRHVQKSFLGGRSVLHRELNSSFQIEGFDKRGFFQSLSVSNRFDFNAIRV